MEAKVKKIFEEFKGMTVDDCMNLIKLFEEEYGIKLGDLVSSGGSAPTAPVASAKQAVEEKKPKKVCVRIIGFNPDCNKAGVILSLKDHFTGMSINDAKALFDDVKAKPIVLKDNILSDDASVSKLMEMFKSKGCIVEVSEL